MERSMAELTNIRQDYHKVRKLSSLDYQKIALVKDKKAAKNKDAKKKKKDVEQKNNAQMDRIEEKRKELILLDNEINQYQQDTVQMTEDITRIDHYNLLAQQEQRRLDFEYKKVALEIEKTSHNVVRGQPKAPGQKKRIEDKTPKKAKEQQEQQHFPPP